MNPISWALMKISQLWTVWSLENIIQCWFYDFGTPILPIKLFLSGNVRKTSVTEQTLCTAIHMVISCFINQSDYFHEQSLWFIKLFFPFLLLKPNLKLISHRLHVDSIQTFNSWIFRGVVGFVISSYCYNGYEANKNHGNHYAGKEMRAQASQVVWL